MKTRTRTIDGRSVVEYLRPRRGETRGRWRAAGRVEREDDGRWSALDLDDNVIGREYNMKRSAVEAVIRHLDAPEREPETPVGDTTPEDDVSHEAPSPESTGTTMVADVKRSASFEAWLATVDLGKTSLWEAFRAGVEYGRENR